MTFELEAQQPESERRLELSQWYTPAWLASRIWEWAVPRPTDRVLEPSAGRGALLAPMLRSAGAFALAAPRSIVAYEWDLGNCDALKALAAAQLLQAGWTFEVRACAFEAAVMSERFDLCVMNPPYEDGQDVAFITRALQLAPRVVGVFRAALFYSEERREFWQRVCSQRIAHLCKRPQFGASAGSSARSDFVVLDLVAVDHSEPGTSRRPRRLSCTVEWW